MEKTVTNSTSELEEWCNKLTIDNYEEMLKIKPKGEYQKCQSDNSEDYCLIEVEFDHFKAFCEDHVLNYDDPQLEIKILYPFPKSPFVAEEDQFFLSITWMRASSSGDSQVYLRLFVQFDTINKFPRAFFNLARDDQGKYSNTLTELEAGWQTELPNLFKSV